MNDFAISKGSSFWKKRAKTPTAAGNLDSVLCRDARIPLRYWRRGFFFTGARDLDLFDATENRFPAVLVDGKTHPVFALSRLPDSVGFEVCPCSSKKPFRSKTYRYIRKGCDLLHTGFRIDRDSHLIEAVTFNIPASIAIRVSFKGEAPKECIVAETLKRPGNTPS